MKKIIILLLLTFSLFCFLTVSKAIERTDTFNSTFIGTRHYVFNNGRFGDFEIFRRDSDSAISYCIEPGIPTYMGEYTGTYNTTLEEIEKKTNISIDSLKLILAYSHFGYGYADHFNDDWYVATQSLIWQELGMDFHFTARNNINNPFSYIIDTPTEIQTKINEIIRLTKIYNTDIVFGSDHFKLIPGESKTITDQNKVLSNYRVKIASNCTAKIEGNNLIITPFNNQPGRVTLELNDRSFSNPYVFYTSNNGQNIMTSGIIDLKEYTITYDLDYGSITINKYDEDTLKCDERLIGTTYELYNQNDDLISGITIGKNCSYTLPNLPFGEYHLKEIKTDEHYKIDSKTHYINISNSNKNPTITLYNKKITREIIINKMYLDNNNIIPEEGATFTITNNTKKDSYTLTIDNKGSASITLPYGEYTLKQTTGKENYQFIEDTIITIDDLGEPIVLSFLNKQYSSKLKIIKVDEENNSLPISNIGFQIYKDNEILTQHINYPSNEEIDTFYTDQNGELTLPEELYPGKYYIKEIDSLIDGYLTNEEKIYFEVNSNSPKEITIRFPNKKVLGNIFIQKKLENNNDSLEGITFNLLDDKKNIINEYITDTNGQIIINHLNLGTYYLKETKTLDNYILDNNLYKIDLLFKDSHTPLIKYNLNIKNYLKKGSIEITKKDISTNETIPNTTISIYNDKDELVFKDKTNDLGIITIKELPIGTYYFIETDAPLGYILNENKHYFTIKEDKEIIKSTLYNKKIENKIKLIKKNHNNQVLKDVLIGLYDTNNTLLSKHYTNELGIIDITLPFGKYYFQEIKPIDGYELTKEKIYFDITEDNKEQQYTLINEEIPDIPKTGYKDKYTLTIIILSIIYIIYYIYTNKTKKS